MENYFSYELGDYTGRDCLECGQEIKGLALHETMSLPDSLPVHDFFCLECAKGEIGAAIDEVNDIRHDLIKLHDKIKDM